MEKKTVRIALVIGESELAALDDWRAGEKIWSRSDAIRRLIAEGVERRARQGDESNKPN